MVVVVVMMVMGWSAEKTSRDVGRARGVGWRRRSRGATVSGGGRLVVHGRERLVVCGGQGEGRGARGRGGRRDQVRLGQVRAGVTVWMMGVVVGVWVRVGNTGLPRGLSHCSLCVAPGDEVPVLELGTARLLRRQLELDKHHVVTDAQCQGEGGSAGQEVTDLQVDKRIKLMNFYKINNLTRLFIDVCRLHQDSAKVPHKEESSSVHIDFLFWK